jgi:hypothetical protein
MGHMRTLTVLLLSSVFVSPAFAQSTPPPPKNAAGSTAQSTTEQIGQVLFSAAEKSIIEGFFGHSATSATQQSPSLPTTDQVTTASGRILKQVLDTVSGQTASTSDSSGSSGASTASSEAGPEGAEGGEGGKTGKDKKKKDKKSKKDKKKGKGKNKKMPPGLAKRKSLPPGLQKQLEKNGRLPPGLAKREMPTDLNTQLPPEKEGTERVIAGNDVVLLDQATGIVLDVLRDVVTGNK